ncbi:MAG: hypothetical protein AAFV72_14000 [Cyanobacteria bacterium J06635_1]
MLQAYSAPKRYRGYVLTHRGIGKLKHQLLKIEKQTYIRQTARTIAERVQLVDVNGIHTITVRKILRQQQGVDRASIERVFQALDLTLEASDCAHAGLYITSSSCFH